jgi:uncharacterized membrane protein
MTEQPVMPPPAPEVSSDDRLWVLLCFLLTPLIPLITLFLEDKKAKPFIKYHNVPTLILGIVEMIVVGILAIIPFVGCLSPLIWIINVLLAIKAYKGVNTDIPVITNFSKQQGWS